MKYEDGPLDADTLRIVRHRIRLETRDYNYRGFKCKTRALSGSSLEKSGRKKRKPREEQSEY